MPTKFIRPPARDFRQRDPTKWMVAIVLALAIVVALVLANRYL
jgi:hypothetical protein